MLWSVGFEPWDTYIELWHTLYDNILAKLLLAFTIILLECRVQDGLLKPSNVPTKVALDDHF